MAQALEPITVMSKEEALGWTIQRAKDGPLTISDQEASRAWGWGDDDTGRMRARRHLQRWVKEGLIAREVTPGGRQTITIGTVNLTVNNTVNTTHVHPLEAPAIAGRSIAFTLPSIGVFEVIAMTLGGIALYIAWIDVNVAADFGRSLARTPEAAAWISGLAWAVTAAGLALPTAALALWQGGQRVMAGVTWGLLVVIVVPMASLAAVGFLSLNVSDTTAGRARTASESATLAAQVERLMDERKAIVENRAVAAIEAEIQATQSQASVAAVWSRTRGCMDVTQAKSGEACAPVLRLRTALGEASRRDALDAELRDKQGRLAALPAVASADPQTEAAAGVVTWLSRGSLAPAASDFAMLRLALFAAVLLIPGILEAVAVSVWGLGREPTRSV